MIRPMSVTKTKALTTSLENEEVGWKMIWENKLTFASIKNQNEGLSSGNANVDLMEEKLN